MAFTGPEVSNRYVEILHNMMTTLKDKPNLVDKLSESDAQDLSTITRALHNHFDPVETPHCRPLYQKFQEFSTKYNLKKFVSCERYVYDICILHHPLPAGAYQLRKFEEYYDANNKNNNQNNKN